MKHLFISVFVFAVCTAGSQTHLLLKDFQDQSITSGGWTTQIVAGTYDWTTSDQGSSGDYYAKMSSFNGSSNDTSITWLISPSMDLSSAVTPTLTFKSAKNYNGPELKLVVSTDYTGTGLPGTATWADITSSATWSPGSFTWTTSGDVDLSAFNGFSSVYLAYVFTGGPAVQGKTWEVDNMEVDETGTTPPTSLSIYDIQYTTQISGESPYKDSTVMTAGIVTAISPLGYFLQDGSGPWNGIFVYDQTNSVSRGDSVEISGVVDEFYEATQIENISSFTLVSSGNNEPAPVILSTVDIADEQYEFVLVKIENGLCTGTQGNGIWDVNDGSGVGLIQSGSTNGIYSYSPTVGNTYWVTGPVSYSFNEFKIWPRDINDIINVTTIESIENEVAINVDLINHVISFSGVVEGSVLITDNAGKILFTDSISENNVVDFSAFAEGIYIVRVVSKKVMKSTKFMKF